MKISTLLSRPMLAAALVLGLTACGTMVVSGAPEVNKAAFGKNKRFAIATIVSIKTFQGQRSLMDAFKDADQIPGANTQPMINQLNTHIVQALGQTGHFQLMPESRVLRSPAYRSAVEDPRTSKVMMFSYDMNVANQYKYLSEPPKMAALARELKVDAVLAVHMGFNIGSGGGALSINGLSFGKRSYIAMASASVVAYNQQGEVIWKDTTMKEAEPGDSRAIVMIDTGAFTSADFEKMQPSAIQIGAKAVDVLVSRLDDTLAGREVERIQNSK